MLDERTLILYLPAMLAITLAPGADTIFVVASALRDGVRGGVFAALGVISGGSVHITLATVGLSALILKSALAFSILKYLGAAYLIYIGVQSLLRRDSAITADAASAPARDARTIFTRGFVTNALNPKVALFVIAFFPQFVSPVRGPVWSQMLELGLIWYATGLVWLTAVGFTVGKARAGAVQSQKIQTAFRYLTGSIFIGLGLRVAVSEPH